MRLTMRMGCAVAGSVAVLAATAAAAATAPGDTAYTGTTAEGVKVKLVVATPGNATAFKIAKTKAECQQGSLDILAATFRQFDTSDPGEFSDKRKSKTTQDGGYVLKDTYILSGSVGADGSSWSGTYEKTTRVIKNGHKVDTCVLSTTWDVS
jgi:hypothetical protein